MDLQRLLDEFEKLLAQAEQHENRKPQTLGIKFESGGPNGPNEVFINVCQHCGLEMPVSKSHAIYHRRCRLRAHRAKVKLTEKIDLLTSYLIAVLLIYWAVSETHKNIKR